MSLKALSHPIRVEIILILHQSPLEATVSSLANAIECSISTMSKHLKILVENRVVQMRREGNYHFYKLAQPEIGELVANLAGEQDYEPGWFKDL